MTVQINAAITNPGLADRILRFLLSEETTAFPAQVLSQRMFSPISEVEAHISAINQVKARWIYEIPQPDGRKSVYIIGNCKMQIREHLRRGGFQHTLESGIDCNDERWWLNRPLPKKRKLRRAAWPITILLTAVALAAITYLCITCL